MTPRTGRGAGQPRGPYRKSREVRQRILDAALEVFAQCGYRSGSLREIATRVEMSEAGLLHHFPSKMALLEAVLEHRDERANRIVDHEAEDGMETLRGMLELARLNATEPGVVELYCVLAAEATSPDHPAHDFFVARYARLRAQIRRALERARATGKLREGVDPAHAAARMIALWDGVQVQWLLDRDSLDMADELLDYLRHILDVPVGVLTRSIGPPSR
ncbi:TetR/AcrR family transcriptional regulator [Pseudactinotalea suaedae]|uniref:TetR/AcrR family transcriptional regulator n=1 Tax=Pseudactinotalea suaedae TaxID=1524924 RepID=UPI0012E28337|nr:TetR/AcrR family transcriptional regulator [Pseudactinotalea suaedae]